MLEPVAGVCLLSRSGAGAGISFGVPLVMVMGRGAAAASTAEYCSCLQHVVTSALYFI